MSSQGIPLHNILIKAQVSDNSFKTSNMMLVSSTVSPGIVKRVDLTMNSQLFTIDQENFVRAAAASLSAKAQRVWSIVRLEQTTGLLLRTGLQFPMRKSFCSGLPETINFVSCFRGVFKKFWYPPPAISARYSATYIRASLAIGVFSQNLFFEK